jgi:hypothetical protein
MRLNYTEVSRNTGVTDQSKQPSNKENIGATASGTISNLDITPAPGDPQGQPNIEEGRSTQMASTPEEVEAYYYR